MKSALLPLLTVMVLCAQVKPGDPAPPIVAPPLDASKPFPGWAAYGGDFVVVDFWATWCGPCLPGLDKIVSLEKEFQGRGVSFLTVALDTVDRVRQYYRDKGIAVATFVEGEHSPTAESFGVRSVPGAALIDREGRIVGVTAGENITAEVLRKVIAGEAIITPALRAIQQHPMGPRRDHLARWSSAGFRRAHQANGRLRWRLRL